ncbi:unnamed protein product [Lota lota]
MELSVLYVAVSLLTGLNSALPTGREFATAFMQNMYGDSDARFMIEVSAPPSSQGSTNVKVSAVGQVFQKDVDPGKSVSFALPNDVEMQGSKRFDKTVVVEASQDVTVVSLNFKQDTADTSVVYPVQEWGTEYYIFTPPSFTWGTYKEFSITNHKDHNLAEVRLRGSAQFQGKYHRAGSKIFIQLEPFESVQIQSEADLSGTKVVSRLPVAVSSGHSCAEKYTACNHVYEQLLPTRSWGKEFIIAPLPYHDDQNRHDSVYVQAFQTTNVSMNVAGNVKGFSISPGQTFELFSQWPYSIYLTSDKGIQVLFEFNGGPADVQPYFDPFLMSILPTNQFSKSYSLEGQLDFSNSVILVAKNDDLKDVQLDKNVLPASMEWRKVDGSDYSWAELNYGTGASSNQISHPTSPIGVYSFGVAVANGYGSPASGNEADCKTIKCEKDERCEIKGTTPTCVKLPPLVKEGTCWAMGDPHYRTFDGYYFNFMGNCTYTMAKNCYIDTSHPAFEVDAQNENRGGSKITYVGKVTIKVYDYTIIIMRSEFGLVRMNYTLWNLPIYLDNGKVKLSQSGMSVVLETDFGLVVQYDWEQHLVISVSGDFAGKVCGLCGNFNSKQDDDLFTPSGELANSQQALGKSWRVPGMAEDAYCHDECVGQCENCKGGLFESLTDQLFCGLLSHVMDGPLSECSAVIEPKVYHENCLYDVCMGEGKWNFFCNTLQVYSDACQRAGVKIHDWRNIAHCPHPACPDNSHYEFCGNACQATCEAPDAPSKCKVNCVETCVCDDGFLLSGTKCVPNTECGCMYEGRYVEAGASFWLDDHCMQRCFCNPANRQMECNKKGCQVEYECKVVEGLIGCHPMTYAMCRASGDPHYQTFDGHVYSFQGTCVYQMAGSCSKAATPGSPVLEPFDVLVQNDGHAKRVGSSTKLVEVNVYGHSIVLSKDHRGSVLINSELINLPAKLNQGNVTVKLVSNFAEIETEFGLTVSYDWNTAVFVKVPSSYAGAMCGLCGNYNMDSKDDLVMKNGKQAASVEEMGKSWRVAETPGCVDDCKDKNHCPDCDFTQIEKFESNAFCGLIRDPKGPFQKCHAILPPGDFFKDCVDDVCNNSGDLQSFCDSLHLYTIACQQAAVEVDQWRTTHFCPKSDFKHPNNSHYEHCASVCHVICGIGSPPTGCMKPCQEGWVCNYGFLLSGDACVPIEQCGCTQKDKYYKHGEIFYPHGQCKEECTCNGTVQCQRFSCGPHEKCEVKNGVRSCQPVGKGVCSISGDPHYKTFDNSTYDFQGTCTYTAAKACNLNGTRLPAFSVAVENERWYAMSSNPQVSVAKLLSVTVYGNTLILRENEIGMIMLNGIMTTIPLNINDKQVQVYQEGTYYVILTDFGLRVTYDMIYHITITVPGNYREHTCGLCGNFNDNNADEFQLPDGKVTKDLLSFGAAWKVAVPGVVCEDGCSGDICPKCDASKKEVFEKDCQVLTDPQGPFAACHNVIDPASYYRDCVYDVCLAVGDRKVLCDSISAYMMDCQTFGVTILNWRTPAFCPLSCSENSHYQICAETCDTPCPGLSDIFSCPTTCAEGCACDDGHYFNGTGCIRLDKCSCYFNGRTYKIGESVLIDDCQQRCTCAISGRVQCVDIKCGSAESCEIQNGSLGCFPKRCVLETGGSITLFNGVTGAIKTTMVAYELVENCDISAPGEWFRVVAKLQECSLTGSKSVSALYVFFSDMMVAVTDKHETWVNGQKVTLPVQLTNDVSIDVSGKSIHLGKKAGFSLSYSWSLGATVTVSNDMVGKVCGACGPLSPSDHLEISEEMMQEYMAPFIAQDFPIW